MGRFLCAMMQWYFWRRWHSRTMCRCISPRLIFYYVNFMHVIYVLKWVFALKSTKRPCVLHAFKALFEMTIVRSRQKMNDFYNEGELQKAAAISSNKIRSSNHLLRNNTARTDTCPEVTSLCNPRCMLANNNTFGRIATLIFCYFK